MKLRLAKKILSQSKRNPWNAAVIRYYLFNVGEHHVEQAIVRFRRSFRFRKHRGFPTRHQISRNIRTCKLLNTFFYAAQVINSQPSKSCK